MQLRGLDGEQGPGSAEGTRCPRWSVVETWRGIYPITAFVRDALHHKLASDTAMALSTSENTLLTACDFWASVTCGTLNDRLEPDPLINVWLAQRAFAQLGAFQVASKLRASLEQLTRGPAPATTQEVAERLEDELTRTADSVDELIARFAVEHIDMDAPRR